MGSTFDQYAKVGSPVAVTWQPTDGDGIAADPGGIVTVDIAHGDGSVLVADGATVGTGVGPYTYTVPAADNTLLDWWSVVWSVDGDPIETTTVEVAGDWYASIADIRAADSSLVDENRVSNQMLLDARLEAQQEAEAIAGVAFVPRYRLARLSGTNTVRLHLPDPRVRVVRAVRWYSDATNYTSFTVGEVAGIVESEPGVVFRSDGLWWPPVYGNVWIEYEHGYDRPPKDLLRLWFGRLRWFLNRRTRAFGEEVTSIRGVDGSIMDVAGEHSAYFAKLKQYGEGHPNIGVG